MDRKARHFLTVLFLAMFATGLAAQIGFNITDEDRAEFARHRTALYERIGDEVAVFFGAYSRGDFQRWRQDNRFYYLTGVEIPFAALVMDGRSDHTILFLAPGRSGRQALFEGETLGPGAEAIAEFGIDDVRSLAEIEPTCRDIFSGTDTVLMVKAPLELIAGSDDVALGAQRSANSLSWARRATREECIEQWLVSLRPGLHVVDVSPVLDDMRRVKTAWEIERMEEACRVAGEGHVAAMKATHPGAMEYEVEAAALEGFVAGGALYPAYFGIVSAGIRNTTLHYSLSSGKARKGDLLLMDFGPDYRYYSADITRTWPVDGTFSKEQRQVYDIVLDVQKKLIQAVKPGVTFAQLSELNRKLFADHGYGDKVIHGPSHYVGMTVHDVGSNFVPFEPGVVITMEPGLYFPDKEWGIRIEDDVLVTEKGHRVLSEMIPKDAEEIEKIMASAKQ